MFHRVLLEEWHHSLPVIGFALTAAVFFSAIIRAMITKKNQCDHLSHLPLDDDASSGSRDDSTGNAPTTKQL